MLRRCQRHLQSRRFCCIWMNFSNIDHWLNAIEKTYLLIAYFSLIVLLWGLATGKNVTDASLVSATPAKLTTFFGLFLNGRYQGHRLCMMSPVSMTPVRKASPLLLIPMKFVRILAILYRSYFILKLLYTIGLVSDRSVLNRAWSEARFTGAKFLIHDLVFH